MAIFLINYIKDSFTQHLVIQQIVYLAHKNQKTSTPKIGVGWDWACMKHYAFVLHEYTVGIQLRVYWSFIIIFLRIYFVSFPYL